MPDDTTKSAATRTIGQGAHPVMVLHGWLGSSGAWESVIPHLDGFRFRYAFPDFRGYGARRSESGEHTLAEAAADVLAVADNLGWDRFSIVGHSMGGTVMQRVLANAPDRVRALLGISPVPAGGVAFDDETRAVFSGAADDPDLRRAIIDLTTGNRLTGTWLDAMTRHSVENSDRRAFADYLLAWAGTDFHREIEGNPVPIKIIVGEHDPALGATTMRATFERWYPACDLEVLAGVGHYAMDEAPVALATAMETFLRTH